MVPLTRKILTTNSSGISPKDNPEFRNGQNNINSCVKNLPRRTKAGGWLRLNIAGPKAIKETFGRNSVVFKRGHRNEEEAGSKKQSHYGDRARGTVDYRAYEGTGF
ncbi:hypothetical protein Trydic_g20968 [Trypoxylus dichotomus]